MMQNDVQQLTRSGGSTYYIYTHSRPDGSLFYVGKGVGDRARDFFQRNPYHRKIVAKHGRENIKIAAYAVHDEVHAYAAERQLILALRKAGVSLCNTDDGGLGRLGVRIGIEQRAKISASLMGHVVTDEARERMRNRRLGQPLSDRTKAKLAAKDLTLQIEVMRSANTGRKRPTEVAQKISQALSGRTLSLEQKAKISASKRGQKPSQETIAKRSIALKAAWARRKANARGEGS